MEDGGIESSSSDSLIDIQIEESLNRESLMSIDSANLKEDIYTLLGFIILLIFTVLMGIFGPSSFSEYSSSWKLLSKEKNASISLPIKGLSSLQRSMAFQIQFERSPNQILLITDVQISYSINFYYDTKLVREYSKDLKDCILKFEENKQMSQSIHLYSTSIIDYNNCDISIHLDGIPKEMDAVSISILYGTEQHTIFQIYFRVICFIITFIFAVILLIRLLRLPPRLWHLEQKITIPLLFFSCLEIDPLFIIFAYYPFTGFIYIEKFFTSIFDAYFYFFILTLFDSLRYKNRKTDKYFFLPKIILFFIYIAIVFIDTSAHHIPLLDELFLPRLNRSEDLMYIVRLASEIFFILLITVSILKAWFQIDITERYKFNMYIVSTATAIVTMIVCDFILNAVNKGKASSMKFITKFILKNLYTILMGYFHWPYEVLNDQTYDNKTDNKSDDGFFNTVE